MRGLILAAGRGSRMGALTADAPKCLTCLGTRTLLDRQIDALRKGGCREIGIVTGYRAELLRPHCDREFHNAAWSSSNMVRSLFAADEWLQQGRVIVSYSDIFYDETTVEGLAEAAGDIAIAFDPDWLALWSARFDNPLSDAETFRRDDLGWLLEIGGRATTLQSIEGQYMGLIKMEPAGWAAIHAMIDGLDGLTRDRIDMTSLLGRLLAAGIPIGTSPVEGLWGECDSPSDLAVYETWLADGRLAP